MGVPVGSALALRQVASAPAANPDPGVSLLYVKSDGKIYTKDSTGAETVVGSGGSSGGGVVPNQPSAPATPVDGQLWYDNDDAVIPMSGIAQLTGQPNTWSAAQQFAAGTQTIGANTVLGAATFQTPLALYGVSGQTADLTNWSNKYSGGTVLGGVAADGSVYAPYQSLTTEYVSTQPANPASGLTVFTRDRARRLPAFVGPTGQDSQLQPALFSNRVATLQAVNNSATQQLLGLTVTNIATPTAVANAGTNFYTSMVRQRYTTSATAGTGAGTRSASAQWMMSSTANKGGFFFVCRFGLGTAATGTRGFIGLSTTTGALSPTTDPATSFLNCIGFAWNAADTQMRFINNDGSGVPVSTSLGSNFPTNVAATYFYEVRIFIPSGVVGTVYWSAHRLNDGIIATGATGFTDLPAADTLMSAHVHYSNGTLAAAHSIDLQSLYIETDN